MYPVYIVSKGRWENPITAKCFLQDGVDFGDTKALFNVGFYITDPKDRKIVKDRKR